MIKVALLPGRGHPQAPSPSEVPIGTSSPTMWVAGMGPEARFPSSVGQHIPCQGLVAKMSHSTLGLFPWFQGYFLALPGPLPQL